MAAAEADPAGEAVALLDDLIRDLQRRGYSAQPVNVSGYAGVFVVNRSMWQLSEAVYIAPLAGGGWWFWWSWKDRIAPVGDVEAAAFKIAYVLTPAIA